MISSNILIWSCEVVIYDPFPYSLSVITACSPGHKGSSFLMGFPNHSGCCPSSQICSYYLEKEGVPLTSMMLSQHLSSRPLLFLCTDSQPRVPLGPPAIIHHPLLRLFWAMGSSFNLISSKLKISEIPHKFWSLDAISLYVFKILVCSF